VTSVHGQIKTTIGNRELCRREGRSRPKIELPTHLTGNPGHWRLIPQHKQSMMAGNPECLIRGKLKPLCQTMACGVRMV